LPLLFYFSSSSAISVMPLHQFCGTSRLFLYLRDREVRSSSYLCVSSTLPASLPFCAFDDCPFSPLRGGKVGSRSKVCMHVSFSLFLFLACPSFFNFFNFFSLFFCYLCYAPSSILRYSSSFSLSSR
jgi:hypothetical protein